jgi:GT2 family glycosyltransferase
MASPGISVIIPSWNGKSLLEKCLPTVLAALLEYGGDCEIIVADDASRDRTMQWLASKHPGVRQVRIPRRQGFVHAANAGLSMARLDCACLLNNDMTVEPGFFKALAATLDADERVFAVSAKAFEAGTEKLNMGQRRRWLENNEIKGAGQETDAPGVGYTLFASGGASLFRTRAVRELGGFDTLYAPFYIEDTDLSYRAWKRGQVCLYEPRAVAHHIGGASTMRKGAPAPVRAINKLRVGVIINRNAILFYMKNITDTDLWAAYRKRIATWAAANFVRLRWTYLLGLAAAAPRMRAARRARSLELEQITVSDKQLFDILNSDYEKPGNEN